MVGAAASAAAAVAVVACQHALAVLGRKPLANLGLHMGTLDIPV
jgi:hypothetical protein